MFGWSSGSNDIDQLIARKKFGAALEVVRESLRKAPENVRLRQQMADLHILDGRPQEAVPLLTQLAGEFVRAGFDAKGIALLKRIQRLEPGHRKVEEQLASLIARRQGTPDLRSRLPKPESASEKAPEKGLGTEPEIGLGTGPRTRVSIDTDELVLVRLGDEGHGQESTTALPEELRGVGQSQLFQDFSQQELVALIDGLQLKNFAAGEIVVTEGEPGDSLFVLASGAVRVYVRNTWGHSEQVRLLSQGELFGEISLLTGQPRTATIVTCGPCDFLELDRPTLDRIAVHNPKVPEIVREVCDRRVNSPEEIEARGELPGLPYL